MAETMVGDLSPHLELSEVEKHSSVVRRLMAGPNSVRPPGEYFVAIEPNSFGLPAVITCPGKTDTCQQDCYAIEAEYRDPTFLKMQNNLAVLESAETVEEKSEKLRELIDNYKTQADKLKIPSDSRRFRIHWDGDFYSLEYAMAWRSVILENSDIKFYAYTRSFQENVNVVPALAGIQNLDLFLSVDCQNVDRAAEVLEENPNVRVAYLVEYREDVDELVEKLGRRDGYRKLACPENMRDEDGRRKLPVISNLGGACSRCTYCIEKPNNWDVVFVKSGYENRAQHELPFTEEVPVVFKSKHRKERVAKPVGELVTVDAQPTLF